MKIKEHTLIILLLFLMLFICIGSVSALENQTNNHGGNEVISVSESQEILTAGEGAYSDVRDDIGSGENISLIKSNDCYTGSAGDIIGIMNPDVIDGQTLATTVTEPIDIWYVNVTAASGGDGKSAETAFNTVNDAINAAHDGNTIMIASGTYTGNYNIGLNVGKNLNFIKYGDGEAIFDAEEKSRIWTVNASSINITGLTFKNGKSRYGGAICFENAISNSVINGIFIDNYVQNYTDDSVFYAKGGAIYFAAMVDNCIINGSFINNSVKMNDYLTFYGDGGAIYFADMVSNSIFDGNYTNNVVHNDGGSLYFNDTVTNSFFAGNFSENFAFQHGSCIYINKNVKNTTFQCTSTENVAVSGSFTFNGGINDCDFNMKITDDGTDHGMLSFLKYTVNNTTFNGTYIKNEAQNGAVYYFEGNVTNCKFNGTYTNNFAFTHGGVFYFIETITNCTIDGIFDENTAQADGGVIYIEEHTQDCIINGTYNNNKAQYGGAFYLMDGAKNCTIDGNYTNNNALYGGVSIINGAQNCTIKGQYNNNTCENLGGAHYFKENVENTTITGTYTNNKAQEQNGGALYFKYNLTNSTINGIFINNTANNGSAVYFTNNIENSTISGKYINNTGNDVIHIMKANMNNIVHDSIFINNNNNILSVESGKLQSVNNWFGNNATNYNEKPEAVNVDMDNWLFLNATSNPDEVTVGSTSVITFKLESYNETSNKISNYDGSKMDIILDLSSTLGSLNQTTALINEEILYTPSKKGNASITGKFENAYDTLCLINILNAPMNVTADNITEGENATINVELPSDATGNVSTDINGKTYSSEVKDGNAIITIPDLLKGDYTLPITYSGDEKYNPLTKDVNITVEGGKVIVSAPDLVKYYSAPERFVVNVTYAKGSPAANKAVNITINGVTYKRTTNENGTASLGINFNSGEYPVIVAVDDVIVNSTVTVKATIYASDIVKVFRNGTQYYATFTDANGTPIANTTVSFNINGVFYNRTTNGNGTAKLNINLMAGDYILTATNPITGEMKSNSIKVISLIESNDLTKYYRNASQFVVRIHSADGGYIGAGEEVKFNVNGVFYTRTTNATGHAKLNINLGQGNYTITTYHKDCSQGNQITVLPVLSADDLVMKYRDGSQFKAKLVDGQGKAYAEQRVQFNINGVLYYRTTGSDGIAKLNINLMSGEYIITSSYNGFNIANKITIRG